MKWPAANIIKKITRHDLVHHKASFSNQSVDIWIAGITVCIAMVGIVMVYNSSVAIALRDFSNQYYYVFEQLRGLAIGLIFFSAFSFIDYHHWRKIALPLLLLNMLLLVCVFLPGIGVSALGAHRWIRILGIVVQPAEIAKFSLIIYLSAWFSFKEQNRLLPFLLFMAMFIGLVLIEPDMGTSMVLILIALTIYLCSGASLKHFLFLIPIFILAGVLLAILSPYRFNRLLTFMDPDRDPQGASYQIKQSLLAIGSGGLSGVGIGMSRQKYEYLPEANTDAIFAVIAEETGFIGSVIMISLFMILVWRGLRVTMLSPDMFGRLMSVGITGWIGIQAGLNIAAMLAIMPLTGIPLPLVSYGSSSLVIVLSSLGILLNISKQVRHN